MFSPILSRTAFLHLVPSARTMPSPKSRELGFYYSHPRNRFWPVLAKIFGEEIPKTPEEKRNFCLRNKIALWDVLKECDIEGASDSSIKNAVPNDLSVILNSAKIQAIFATGATAAKLYKKFIEPETKILYRPIRLVPAIQILLSFFNLPINPFAGYIFLFLMTERRDIYNLNRK